ncbi:unnamed protein product [Brassicogethes aeneus]|uniref:Uncharacterized protein n=1 Tax=Brassicogethes aeneus TaxID=1431903 RepID=A0A9P0BEX3_BRAAE|nr:unnamed protein product [Brassicogethes aeneus]
MPGHRKTASRLRSRSNSFRSYPLRKNPKSNSSLGKYRVKDHHDQYNEKTKSIDNCKFKTRRKRKYVLTRSSELNICHKNSKNSMEESIESIPRERSRSKTVVRKMYIKTPSRLKIATKRSRGESLSRSRSQATVNIPKKRLPKLHRSSRNMSQVEATKLTASSTNLMAKIEKVSKTVNYKSSTNRKSMCKCNSPVSSNEMLFSVNRISSDLGLKKNFCRRCRTDIFVQNSAASLEEVPFKTVKPEVNSVYTLNSTQTNSISNLEKFGKSQSQLCMPSRNVSLAVSEDVKPVLKLENIQTTKKKKASDMIIADLKNVKVEIKQENVQLKRKTTRKHLHSNPFINFLRQLKKNHRDWHTCKVAIEGSRKWCAMTDKDRFRSAQPQKKINKNAAINTVKPSRRKSVNRRAKSSGRQRKVK